VIRIATGARLRQSYVGTTVLVVMLAALAASCAPQQEVGASGEEAPTPAPARRQGPGRHAVLPDGSIIKLELAVTPEEITRGLMFRPSLPDDRGMLFLFESNRVPSFWMKNTMIPLDLLFLDGEGMIAEIIPNAQPCKIEPCPQYVPSTPAWAVLELNAGAAERYGLAAGDQLTFKRVEGYPRVN
jgi:uncharacterized membrane protein (UPF0127 family)